ncbi:MAG: hypothetical protein U1E90_00205 [Burkholderiaceae bacterium]
MVAKLIVHGGDRTGALGGDARRASEYPGGSGSPTTSVSSSRCSASPEVANGTPDTGTSTACFGGSSSAPSPWRAAAAHIAAAWAMQRLQ